MKYLIHVPVHKRYGTLQLFDNTVKHLQKTHNIEVLAVGSCEGDRNVCENFGYHYYSHPNRPLGSKFQKGITEAKKYDFDALILLGSDDILSAGCLDLYQSEIERGYDFVGFLDCYFFDLDKKNMRYWGGYKGERQGEPIGAWRCFSRRGLDKMNWKLWNADNNSPDYQMWSKVLKNKINYKLEYCDDLYRIVDLKTSENVTKFGKFPNSKPVNAKKELKGFFSPQEINNIITY